MLTNGIVPIAHLPKRKRGRKLFVSRRSNSYLDKSIPHGPSLDDLQNGAFINEGILYALLFNRLLLADTLFYRLYLPRKLANQYTLLFVPFFRGDLISILHLEQIPCSMEPHALSRFPIVLTDILATNEK